MQKLKIAYFGTPLFSANLLEQLIQDKTLPLEIALVVTQPDKPVGKKQIFTPSPVKLIAQKYKIKVWDTKLQGQSIFTTLGGAQSALRASTPTGEKNDLSEVNIKKLLQQIDLAIVYAFGFKELIPLDLLEAPDIQFEIGEGKTSGFINIHPSLLPRYRGSSPIAYPILIGDELTGVSLFVMDEKMDHGPLIDQQTMKITLNDVRTDMEKKLTSLGTEMIKKCINSLTRQPVNPLTLEPQDHALTTRAPYFKKEDGFVPFPTLQKALKNEPITMQELPHIIREYVEKNINSTGTVSGIFTTLGFPIKSKLGRAPSGDKNDRNEANIFTNSSKIIYNFWRGISPWPGMWTRVTINGVEKRLKILSCSLSQSPVANRQPPVAHLKINTVQLEGKKPVDFPTFQKAYQVF